MKITTNNHKIPLLYYFQLPPKWQKVAQKDFDWDKSLEEDSRMFLYKGNLYHLGNFPHYGNGSISMWGPKPEVFSEWDSYVNDTFFSGIVIRFCKDEYGYEKDSQGNQLINVGWFYE